MISVLQKLRPEEYAKIQHLLSGDQVNIEIRAIAAGNSPGWVFVDNYTQPQTALIFSSSQCGFYFLGQENNPLFIQELYSTLETLVPKMADLGLEYFEYSGTSLEWESRLEDLFAHKDYSKSDQHVYIYPNLATGDIPNPQEGPGYTVEEITRELLSNKDIDTTYVEKNILDWWDSRDMFFQLGAGYCVVCDNKTVATCFTSFAAGKHWGLGVYTHPDYRQRGFAKETGIMMTRRCQAKQIQPYWDCMESNTPSWRLAKSLGFSLGYVYQVYDFKLT